MSYAHFSEILNPPYMGTTPKNGPIGFIFKLDLLVVLKSICAKFGSDSSTPSARKVFTDRQTDGQTDRQTDGRTDGQTDGHG